MRELRVDFMFMGPRTFKAVLFGVWYFTFQNPQDTKLRLAFPCRCTGGIADEGQNGCEAKRKFDSADQTRDNDFDCNCVLVGHFSA